MTSVQLAEVDDHVPRLGGTWHLCPVHGVESCQFHDQSPNCWNPGYDPVFGPHRGIAHFCWTPHGYSPGWFTGLLYYTRKQAEEALHSHPLPVKTCPRCGNLEEDRRGNGFDGVDSYHTGQPIGAET